MTTTTRAPEAIPQDDAAALLASVGPPVLRRMGGEMRAAGRLDIESGNVFARLVARLAGLPRPRRDVPVELDVRVTPEGLTKTRNFGGEIVVSRLRGVGGDILECCGPARMLFRLVATADSVEWRLRRFHLGPIRLPLALAPRISVVTRAEGSGWRVEISISAPVLGLLTAWKGHMEPA